MLPHQRSSAILIAALLVPFGVAIYQDANATHTSVAGDSSESFEDNDLDEYLPDEAYNPDDENGALQAKLAQLADTPSSMSASFFDELFLDGGKTKSAAMVGPLAGIEFGLRMERLQEIKPESVDWAYEGLANYPQATVDLHYGPGGLDAVTVSFPDDGSALRSLRTQWGAPTELPSPSTARIWLNETSKTRATLNQIDGDTITSIRFNPYQDLNEVIAPNAFLFGFEHKDLLALSQEEISELRSQSSNSYENAIEFSGPQLATNIDATYIALQLNPDGVESVQFSLQMPGASTEAFDALLVKKLGKPTKTADAWSTTYTFKHKSRLVVLVRDDSHWTTITITRK